MSHFSRDKLYLPSIVLLPLLVMSAIGAVNYWLDPYQIHSALQHEEYSAKPAIYKNMRMHKAYQIVKVKPEVLILGTSKAIQGYPLHHPFFEHGNTYNAGLTLASSEEMYHYFEHARAQGNLKKVLVALDFISFNVLTRSKGLAAGFDSGRLHTPGTRQSIYLDDYASSLFSVKAMAASMAVLNAGDQSDHEVLGWGGGRTDADIRQKLEDGGHRSNTERIEEFMLRNVLAPKPLQQFSFETAEKDAFKGYRKILEISHQENIETILVINPSHARHWELIRRTGLWSKLEQWKMQLVEINDSVARQAGNKSFPLWDFTAANKITTENFPPIEQALLPMRYYYEAVHFSQTTGSLVLDKISYLERPWIMPADFGILLDADSLKSQLLSLRQAQEIYSARFNNDTDRINKNVLTIVGENRDF